MEVYGRKVRALDDDIDAFPTSVEKSAVIQGGQLVTTNEQRHWTRDADLTARYNRLSAEVEAVWVDYVSAQNCCAGSLAAVSGGQPHRVDPAPGVDLRSGSVVDEVFYDAGTFFGARHEEQRFWGNKTVPYRPHDVVGLLQGFGAGAIEFLDGIWSLIPAGNMTKVDRAWGGINTMAGAVGTLAASPRTWWDKDYARREGSKIGKAMELFGSVPSSFAHVEDGLTNVGWAIGGGTFNVLGVVYTRGAGAALNGGTLVSKAGLAAEHLSIATMDRARFAALSAKLSAGSVTLLKTGAFLDKPGSLALKVSDLLMPNATAKVQDSATKASVATWSAITGATSTTVEAAGGAKRFVAGGIELVAEGFRSVESGIPAVLTPDPGGVMARSSTGTGFPDRLDNTAAALRENNPPAFVPPKAAGTDVPTHPAEPAVVPDHFVLPAKVENTVVVKHGDLLFPVSRRDNFAARTGLQPNTEYIVDHRTTMKDAVGGHEATTLEKFYTDENGTVTIANTYAGVRGAWSVELNKPVPNVTYNVVVQVDGGLQNTFTIKMDSDGHPISAKGHIVSTLVGDMNRNGYQQRKAGWLGGPGYDGGHAAPSALGFIGEGAGVFPQHEWQNRKAGTPNEIDQAKQLHQQEALRRLGRNETRRRRPAKCSPRKSRQSRHLPLWQFA